MELIRPESILSWMRGRVANQVAGDGAQWAEAFSKHHSGTYVNQWIVVDSNKFVKGQKPLPGFLTVLEELPGKCVYMFMYVSKYACMYVCHACFHTFINMLI